ncbi:hypothetical protein [Neobacillus niacini]|uniref:hypothetical protein n=1 Tax=Neobacillus niacini TaxID=86668 RepID=UPI0021CB1299|nr:hypothetical protein [Neobacillus niacini]MCM3763983.1 hypothetical protein [Neobacillus niacini]
MKYSTVSLERLMGGRTRARRKAGHGCSLEDFFEDPIIHKEIHGDKVYVPLNLHRAWMEG